MPDRLLGIGELRAAQHAHMVQAAVCIGNRKARMGAANVADKSCLCFRPCLSESSQVRLFHDLCEWRTWPES